MNAGLLLYILCFPVYNKEGGYNNFTSARSWPVITLSIWEACLLSTPPHPLTLGCKRPHPCLILHSATSCFESKTLNDAASEGSVFCPTAAAGVGAGASVPLVPIYDLC